MVLWYDGKKNNILQKGIFMKTTAYYDVHCERCGFSLSTDFEMGMAPTKREALQWAREKGFHDVGGETLCPNCIESIHKNKGYPQYVVERNDLQIPWI